MGYIKYKMPFVIMYNDHFCNGEWLRKYQMYLNECRVVDTPYYHKLAIVNPYWTDGPSKIDPIWPKYITPSDTYGSEYSPDDAYQDYVYYQNDIPRPSAHDDYFFYADDWDPPSIDDLPIRREETNQVFTKWHKSYEPLQTNAPTMAPGQLFYKV